MVSIIFTYSNMQAGTSADCHNSWDEGGWAPCKTFLSIITSQSWSQTAGMPPPAMLVTLKVTWTSSPAHKKWHEQAGPREEGYHWRWWATLRMPPDVCGCIRERVKAAEEGETVRGSAVSGARDGAACGTALSGWFSYDSWSPRGTPQSGG